MSKTSDFKARVLGTLLDTITPQAMTGVGSRFAELKYDDGDKRGSARKLFSTVGEHFGDTFSRGNIVNSMMPKPIIGMMKLIGDYRKATKDDRKEGKKEVQENSKLIEETRRDIDINTVDGGEDDDADLELLETMVDLQTQSIELLKGIEKNTKHDDLAQRESDLEKKAEAAKERHEAAQAANAKEKHKGAISGAISDAIGNMIQGALGLKGAQIVKGVLTGGALKGSLKSVGSAIGTVLKKASPSSLAKIIGIGATGAAIGAGAPPSAVPVSKTQQSTTIFDKTKAAVSTVKDKAVGTARDIFNSGALQSAKDAVISRGGQALSAVKSVGGDIATKASNAFQSASTIAKGTASSLGSMGASLGKLAVKAVGTPLTVATTAYDINEVYKNETLSETQKNREYTKIGTRLAGVLAGAKAGAAAGGGVGAAGGALFGGVGAAPGAAIGSVIGGIAGGIGGYSIGDAAGEAIGNATFKDQPQTKIEPIVTTDKVERIHEMLTNNTDMPKKLTQYVNGTNDSIQYGDVKKEYYEYLDKNGIAYSDASALNAMVLTRGGAFKNKVAIVQLDKMAEMKSMVANNINYSDMVSPPSAVTNMADFGVGESRNNALNSLSDDIVQNHREESKVQIIQQPVVIQQPAPSGSNISTNDNSGNRSRLGVPSSRNQDSTIQRLLNSTFKPLIG